MQFNIVRRGILWESKQSSIGCRLANDDDDDDVTYYYVARENLDKQRQLVKYTNIHKHFVEERIE